jgi:chorismate mutase
MTADAGPPDLETIRDRLDLVDRRLVEVLSERSRLITEVVRFKRAHGMKVVDRDREERMLLKIGDTAAEAGLDPRIARQAFTLLEVEQLGPDS